MTNNILMLHRVQINQNPNIPHIYYQRKMVIESEKVYAIIDQYLNDGYQFGSLKQCFLSNQFFHLSFDDGFKEHLKVAYLLKEKYHPPNNSISFAINVSNSFWGQYTGMDVIYSIIENGKLGELCDFLKIPTTGNLEKLKLMMASLPPQNLLQLSKEIDGSFCLEDFFLNEKEVKELANHFEISSHGITHRFLTCHLTESKKEILKSKKILETKLNKQINVFCYPEGKNNLPLQNHCQIAGYQFALSIRHENHNPFCIGRKTV